MNIVILVFQAWVLVLAVGIDAFACSFGYGTSKVKIPFKSVMIINLVCTALLSVGLFFGALLGNFLTDSIAGWISFAILFSLGVFKIFDSTIKKIIRKRNGVNKEVKFTFFNLQFLLKVYADPVEADSDDSKELAPKEAAPLAIALGLDGLSVGFGIGIGITIANAFLIVGLSLFTDIILVIFGCFLGNRLAKKISLDLSWLSGVILIIIAFVGLFI
ncbi:MAG: manganese efflux pump [Erysipelotrichales bacterium]|nr:manganese efflux pump [Erysipelotrichales bacterium]